MFPRKRLLPLALSAALIAPAASAADTGARIAGPVPATVAQSRFNQFIVHYADPATARNRADVEQRIARALATGPVSAAGRSAGRATATTPRYLRALGRSSAVVRTSRSLSAQETDALLTRLAADPNVTYVEPDLMMQVVDIAPAAVDVPVATNDPLAARLQWDHQAPDGAPFTVNNDPQPTANFGGANVARAWNLADGQGITVAVLDTGITAHPDLDTSLANDGYDFISAGFVSGRASDGRVPGGWDTGDWTDEDQYLSVNGGCVDPSQQLPSSWHGTHVAGIVAQKANNGIGLAGVAYNARLLPVRVIGHCGGATSDIVDAITWASGGSVDGVPANRYPAQVINLSLGGGGDCSANSAFGQAISAAIARGTVIVAAAGNSGSDVANFSPASCPGVIAVAATGITSRRAYYSNYGPGIAIAAPGGGVYANDAGPTPEASRVSAGVIWSAINAGTRLPTAETRYGGYAGTSQAAPHVAGAVALALGARRDAQLSPATPVQLRRLLSSTAAPLAIAPDQPIGAGLLDTYALVNAALSPDIGNPLQVLSRAVPTATQSGFAGESFTYALTVPAGARNLTLRTYGGSGDVALYVKTGSAPATDGSDATYRSIRPGNNEAITLTRPAPGVYYLRVNSPTGEFAGLTVLGTYMPQ